MDPVSQIDDVANAVAQHGFGTVFQSVMLIVLVLFTIFVFWDARAERKRRQKQEEVETVVQQAREQMQFNTQQSLNEAVIARVIHGNGEPDAPGLKQIATQIEVVTSQVEVVTSQVEALTNGAKRDLEHLKDILYTRPCLVQPKPGPCDYMGDVPPSNDPLGKKEVVL
jgi:hypothetical protein